MTRENQENNLPLEITPDNIQEEDNENNRQPPLRKTQVSNDDRERIVTKTLEGHSVKEISQMYQNSYHTVYGIVQRFLKQGLVNPLQRGGDRRSLLTTEIKEHLIAHVDQECVLTLRQLVAWVSENFQINVSDQA